MDIASILSRREAEIRRERENKPASIELPRAKVIDNPVITADEARELRWRLVNGNSGC